MKKLRADHGIAWEPCAPYSQNQNGVVERSIGIILSRVRALMIQASLFEKLWAEAFMISIFLINISPTSTPLYSELIEDGGCKVVTPYEAWTGTPFNVQCGICIIGSDIYIHKEGLELDSAGKLAPCAKKMTLVGFRDSIIYQVYDREENKIHVSCSVEINEKSMKENGSISAPDKGSDTQGPSDAEKLSIERSTESPITPSDGNENFNPLSGGLAFKAVEPPKQSKKRGRPWKNPLLEDKIISTTDDQISDPAARKAVQLRWKESIVAPPSQNSNQPDTSLTRALLAKMDEELLFKDLGDWGIWYASFHDFKVFSAAHSPESTYVNGMKVSISYAQAIASPESSQWRQAMDEEIASIRERNVYTLVPPPKGKKSLGGK